MTAFKGLLDGDTASDKARRARLEVIRKAQQTPEAKRTPAQRRIVAQRKALAAQLDADTRARDKRNAAEDRAERAAAAKAQRDAEENW